jgi:hypothetical protein
VVPFVWQLPDTAFQMELVGGVVGIAQRDDGSLEPAIGWAVRDRVRS